MAAAVNSAVVKGLGVVSRVNEWICIATRNAAAALLMAMTVIVLTQIVFRYILNDSLIWTEEVSKTMMVWIAFLVAPWAYRYGANVSIEMFADELPKTLQRVLHLLLNLLVLWIIAVFWLESFGMVDRGFTIRAASLPLQVGWFFAVVPFALGVMLLVGLELFLRDLLGLIYPEDDFAVPGSGTPMEGE